MGNETPPTGPDTVDVRVVVMDELEDTRATHESQLVIHDLVKLLPNVQEMHRVTGRLRSFEHFPYSKVVAGGRSRD
jgi:hypothetical protein